MLESWERDVAIYLESTINSRPLSRKQALAYILFHILLPNLHSTLTHLKAHLCRMVIHEAAKCRAKIGPCIEPWVGLLLLLLTHMAPIRTVIVALLGLRRRG